MSEVSRKNLLRAGRIEREMVDDRVARLEEECFGERLDCIIDEMDWWQKQQAKRALR